jgi:O-antigen ligase
MPNAHNGYYDATLEMGYIGLSLLIMFLTTTLHCIGRLIDRDSARGWVILSIALYILIHNGLETTWMRGFEFMWIVFLIIATDLARSCQAWERNGPQQRIFPQRVRAMRRSVGRRPRSIAAPPQERPT